MMLLIARLVVGELAHAHGSAHPDADMAAGDHDTSHCVEFSHQGSSSLPEHETDCCNTAECACPCVHTPAAAMVASSISAHLAEVRAAGRVQCATPDRPFKLFRPPA
jgi:hypothetical protein